MKIKKSVLAIVAFVLVACCSGCSLNFFSVESLLSPPAQSGKNGEVQEAFNKAMSDKKIQLKTLASGEYKTSFVLFDVNGDGIEEAFVFYSDSSTEASVRMALMECEKNDKWTLSTDVKGAGNGAYDINFKDLNNDGIYEILVSWSLLDGKTTKIVSAYEPIKTDGKKMELKALGNEYCNYKIFVDFNGDKFDDVVLVYLDDTVSSPKTYLRSFTFTENKELIKFGEVFLDGLITSVANIQTDVAVVNGKASSRIFVDCYKNDRTIFTEVVYWDNMHSIPVKAFEQPSVTNLRSARVLCRDIDNDGYIEIPVKTKLYGDEKTFKVKINDEEYFFSLLEWKNVKGDSKGNNIKTLFNPIDMYLFKFNWDSRVTVTYDSLREALLFSKWNERGQKTEGELFYISYRSKPLQNEIIGDVLYEDDNGAYFYKITELGEKYGITDEGIVSSFINMK